MNNSSIATNKRAIILTLVAITFASTLVISGAGIFEHQANALTLKDRFNAVKQQIKSSLDNVKSVISSYGHHVRA